MTTKPKRADGQKELEQAAEPICGGLYSDQPTIEDSLGFTTYVKAVATFLLDDGTSPPLTMSVEGEWGAGKTSFMHQLRAHLKRQDRHCLTVWFDPWRNEKEGPLWASFAAQFLRDVSKQRWIFLLNQRLWWMRLRNAPKRPEKVQVFLRWFIDLLTVLTVLSLPVLVWYLLRLFFPGFLTGDAASAGQVAKISDVVEFGAKVAPTLTLVILFLTTLRSSMESLLSSDLKRYLNDPHRADQQMFLNQFHQDFSYLVDLYAKQRKVFVFIDDLDRCDAARATEMMQAINMLTADNPRLIFIIGMDRVRVAAGFAMKYEKLLPYVFPTYDVFADAPDERRKAVAGLEHGFAFLEKFIQLPVQIPHPTEDDLEWLLKPSPRVADNPPTEQARRGINKPEQSTLAPGDLDPNSRKIRDILKVVAPVLDHNPRRIKQFVNLFRLRAWIANDNLLFSRLTHKEAKLPLTPEQLGKFVAIALRWPSLVTELSTSEQLLSQLQAAATGQPVVSLPAAQMHWSKRSRLTNLLLAKCKDGPEGELRWSLMHVNVGVLLQISPPVTPQVTGGAEQARKLPKRVLSSLQNQDLREALAEMKGMASARQAPPNCFITYAWNEPTTEHWVERRLISDLRRAGIEVLHIPAGNAYRDGLRAAAFSKIVAADYYLLIGTPWYRQMFDVPGNGTNEDTTPIQLVAERLTSQTEARGTVLGVLRKGDAFQSFPVELAGEPYFDFRRDESYATQPFALVCTLYNLSPSDPRIERLRRMLRGTTLRR